MHGAGFPNIEMDKWFLKFSQSDVRCGQWSSNEFHVASGIISNSFQNGNVMLLSFVLSLIGVYMKIHQNFTFRSRWQIFVPLAISVSFDWLQSWSVDCLKLVVSRNLRGNDINPFNKPTFFLPEKTTINLDTVRNVHSNGRKKNPHRPDELCPTFGAKALPEDENRRRLLATGV